MAAVLRIDTAEGPLHAVRWSPQAAADGVAPIVLLHDSLGCIALWRDFPERLANATRREVIAYDRLGYGKSAPYPGPQPESFIVDEAQHEFDAVREQLNVERFALLGHSVGGSMAAVTAGRYPLACEALITVAAQAFTEPRTLAGIREAERSFIEPGGLSRLAKYHGDKADWVLRSWVDNWHSEAFREWRLDDALTRVRCPTLAIHGELDEYGSREQPARIAALTPGPSEPYLLTDCGHVPHRECPERLIGAIAAFLETQPGANTGSAFDHPPRS
ncbi:alpha/beta fold hydrolase [Billgrantia gudaonensis]|uniref:Pimeloyl-ACP methyl ester carboxylesterase n=1 Tax=Billgrantia gudaonensis TaxID=376427 RepID=A0A1G8N673_9GAMM|nr:alpha/beta hydrolase [Halomonas gudaonensis]SDI75633.1 Pimeloyl-ACP methyl ester carboxylesterase [Halomonas gudaonensis]